MLRGRTFRKKVIGLVKLLLPFCAIAGVLAAYNFARFGNPLESGYSFQVNGLGILYSTVGCTREHRPVPL